MRYAGFAAIAIAALCSSGVGARAEDAEQGSSADVLERARPEYDARGIRLGTFFLYPEVAAGAGYDDNVFNSPTATSGNFFSLAPRAKLQSAWSRHELSILGEAKSYTFSDQPTEDRTDWLLGAALRLDIVRGMELKLEAEMAQQHDARGKDLVGGLSIGDPESPTQFARRRFAGEFGNTFNRVNISLGGALTAIDYEDTPRVGGGTFNNDDRDRSIMDAFAKLAVNVSEDTAVFLRGRIDDHDFDALADDNGFNRDSTAMGLDAGLEFRMTHVLVGEIYGGYMLRSFDDTAFADANELSFGAGLRWFPTMLTTLRLDAGRSVEDTSLNGFSSYVSTRAELGIDHELFRNLIVSGRLGFESQEYLSGSTRTDDIFHGALSGRYLINNNFHLDAGWDYTSRSSSDLPFDYSTGQFQLSLTGKM